MPFVEICANYLSALADELASHDQQSRDGGWEVTPNVEVRGLRGFSRRSARLPGWA